MYMCAVSFGRRSVTRRVPGPRSGETLPPAMPEDAGSSVLLASVLRAGPGRAGAPGPPCRWCLIGSARAAH